MGRPRKQTVNYFPHDADASEKKTLYILESKFGNDGYAFWFKLLELLAKNEGHFYDVRNPAAWEFLLAKTHVSEDIGNQIMALLLELDAIDRELWGEKIIWVQHFVDGVADAYRNRKTDPPPKPCLLRQEGGKEVVTTPRNPQGTVVSTVRNPHTILKDTILDNTKEKATTELDFEDFKEELRSEFPDVNFDNEVKKFHLYWSEGGRKLKRPKFALRNWMEKAREIKGPAPGKKEYKHQKGSNLVKD